MLTETFTEKIEPIFMEKREFQNQNQSKLEKFEFFRRQGLRCTEQKQQFLMECLAKSFRLRTIWQKTS